jgi:hypothetical protein
MNGTKLVLLQVQIVLRVARGQDVYTIHGYPIAETLSRNGFMLSVQQESFIEMLDVTPDQNC